MDTSINQFTQLVFRHGAIQTSPEHVAMLNNLAMTPFEYEGLSKNPTEAGYKVILNGYAEFIRKKERTTDEFQSLQILLNKLRALPRPIEAKQLKGRSAHLN